MPDTEIDLYDFVYPNDYVPVRGDTIRYFDVNWRYGVVINSQDNEVTFLTPENQTKTMHKESVKIAQDQRMRLLITLNEEDAVANREAFLEAFLTAAKKREEEDALAKGAIVDDDGSVIAPKTRGKQMNKERAKEISHLVNSITEFIEKNSSPVYKTDIFSFVKDDLKIEMNGNTYNLVMKKILAGHKIVKSGQKRGTNYRIAGRSYN